MRPLEVCSGDTRVSKSRLDEKRHYWHYRVSTFYPHIYTPVCRVTPYMGVISWNSVMPVVPVFISNEWRVSIRLLKKRKMRLMTGITGLRTPVMPVMVSTDLWKKGLGDEKARVIY